MKLGAVTLAYRDEGTIRGTLSCLEPFVDKHIVLIGEKPLNGEDEGPDRTEEICREFHNVEIVKGVWDTEEKMRNLGIDLTRDCDWMIGFDSDEMMTAEDMNKLIDYLGKTTYDAIGLVSKVYWWSTDYRFDPDPDHTKVCITRCKSNARYVEKQCVSCAYDSLHYRSEPYITHHHLSYCKPKDMLGKVLHYCHANEFDGRKWYEEHFKNWSPGMPVYQPFGTKWEAVYDPLPEELKGML